MCVYSDVIKTFPCFCQTQVSLCEWEEQYIQYKKANIKIISCNNITWWLNRCYPIMLNKQILLKYHEVWWRCSAFITHKFSSLTAQMRQIRETRSCIACSYAQQNVTEEHIVGVQGGCWKHLKQNGLGRQTEWQFFQFSSNRFSRMIPTAALSQRGWK